MKPADKVMCSLLTQRHKMVCKACDPKYREKSLARMEKCLLSGMPQLAAGIHSSRLDQEAPPGSEYTAPEIRSTSDSPVSPESASSVQVSHHVDSVLAPAAAPDFVPIPANTSALATVDTSILVSNFVLVFIATSESAPTTPVSPPTVAAAHAFATASAPGLVPGSSFSVPGSVAA